MMYPRHFFQSQCTMPNASQVDQIINAATCDVLILDPDFLISACKGDAGNPVAKIKSVNRNTAIFGYVSPADYQPYQSDFVSRIKLGFDQEWLVKNATGDRKPISIYTGADGAKTYLMNVTMPQFREHLVDAIASFECLRSLDGIYLDWGCDMGYLAGNRSDGTPYVPGGVDLFNSGSAVSRDVLHEEWRRGWNDLAKRLQDGFGFCIIGNCGYQGSQGFEHDGAMIEGFMAGAAPTAGAWGSWSIVMKNFAYYADRQFSFIQHNAAKSGLTVGSQACVQAQRFAFASAMLLSGGIVLSGVDPYADRIFIDELGVDRYGAASMSHEDMHWLGSPLNDAYDATFGPGGMRLVDALFNKTPDLIESRVWGRDFENGAVRVLPGGSAAVQVPLGPGLRFIKGIVDMASNNGANTGPLLSVSPRTGVVLFRVN